MYKLISLAVAGSCAVHASVLEKDKLTLESVVLQGSGNVLLIDARPVLPETSSTTTLNSTAIQPSTTCGTNNVIARDWFNDQRLIKVDVRCSGGTDGTGNYLFTLPTGVQFNPTHDPFTSNTVTLLNENFQSPMLATGTYQPGFPGWSYANNPSWPTPAKSRRSDVRTDFSGDPTVPNQGIQLEYTHNEAHYSLAHNWVSTDIFTVTLNAGPLAFHGGSDRYIEPSLRQQDGTTLWSASSLLPHYNSFGQNPWPAELTFTYTILASSFTAGTQGSPIKLVLRHSGSRGVFIDNVMVISGSDAIPETSAACSLVATKLGLEIGGGGLNFADLHSSPGCHAYDSGTYAGKAYFGTGGNSSAMRSALVLPKYRPIDPDSGVGVHNAVTIPVRGLVWYNDKAFPAVVMPFDSTRFRVMAYNGGGSNDVLRFLDASFTPVSNGLRLAFEFEISY